MITITNTIAITITNALAIAITIGIIKISPGPNACTYAHNQWDAGTTFRWKIRIRDLLSPS
jgi:hypothetical protein